MKVKITDAQQKTVSQFLERAEASIAGLRNVADRVDRAWNRTNETDAEIAALPDAENISDKEIQRRLVLVERKRFLSMAIPELEDLARGAKADAARVDGEASELLRKLAGRQIESYTRSLFESSLPSALRNDPHLAADAWGRSIICREMSRVINPPSINVSNDARSICDEIDRRLETLRLIASGGNLAVPGEELAQAATARG